MNNKIYAYENFCGDKGIIVAESYEDAEKLYKDKYPKREIIDVTEIADSYTEEYAYLYEVDDIQNGKLYDIFLY